MPFKQRSEEGEYDDETLINQMTSTDECRQKVRLCHELRLWRFQVSPFVSKTVVYTQSCGLQYDSPAIYHDVSKGLLRTQRAHERSTHSNMLPLGPPSDAPFDLSIQDPHMAEQLHACQGLYGSRFPGEQCFVPQTAH
eukprot:1156129-Pelagomonas_calceolata.AAC.6